jgi:V/A-type H+-transporting ATPase subunit D
MEKLKLTKGELKKQKDDLRRFDRFLPMLQLKKQQLQIQLLQIDAEVRKVEQERKAELAALESWIALLDTDPNDGLRDLLKIQELVVSEENIAGVELPVFERVEFDPVRYDLMEAPLWFDRAVPVIQKIFEQDARLLVLHQRRERIARELMTTSQRVNLFERIRIPAARDNIRRLKIFLGDQQAAAVVRGKIAKRKRQEAEPVPS